MNSIDDKKHERLNKAISIYESFIASYADTKYKSEAKQMFDNLNKELEIYSN